MRFTSHRRTALEMSVNIQEYNSLESERLERIKQRDGFLNLNVVGIGVTASLAAQGSGQRYVWLLNSLGDHHPWMGLSRTMIKFQLSPAILSRVQSGSART